MYDIDVVLMRNKYPKVYNLGIIILSILAIITYVSLNYNYETYYLSSGKVVNNKLELIVLLDDIKYIIKKKYKLLISLGSILLIVIVIGPTFGRYVVNSINEQYYKSKNFYFYSNDLKNKTYKLYTWDGISTYSVSFTVNNALDELNWTNDDISYNITTECSSNIGNISCTSLDNQILIANEVKKTTNKHTITFTKTEGEFTTGDYATVIIKATSTSPYAKELTSTYKIYVNELKLSYYIKDTVNGNYFDLIIANNTDNKNITLTFNPEIINVDNTNYYVQGATKQTTRINNVDYINSLTMSILKDNVYSIRFYKNNPSIDYTNNSNIITLS